MAEKQPDYLSYLLRLWRDDPQASWRGSLVNPRTGEQRHFATVGQLFDQITEQTSDKETIMDEVIIILENFPRVERNGQQVVATIDHEARLEMMRNGVLKYRAAQERAQAARITEVNVPGRVPRGFTLAFKDASQAKTVMQSLTSVDSFTLKIEEQRGGRLAIVINHEEQ
ncbi:MAG: hypothetical protein QNJ45_13125 [Ardenticatenaceae bacterium]|nr:hypothetical protein [Ardenticatenaceae bacterium]